MGEAGGGRRLGEADLSDLHRGGTNRRFKAATSVDLIVSVLPPGGSSLKG